MHDDGIPNLPDNLAGWDRALRIAVAATLLALGLSGLFPEAASAWLRLAAYLPFVLGALGWCPVYQLLGIRTRDGRRRFDAGLRTSSAGGRAASWPDGVQSR